MTGKFSIAGKTELHLIKNGKSHKFYFSFIRTSHELSCSDSDGLIAEPFTLTDVFFLILLGCSYVTCAVITKPLHTACM